jgi:acetyltransferase-like isoleucine patch superfamily enzyme
MNEKLEESNPEDKNEVVKEEIKLQYHIYISIFIVIFYTSWVLPGICFFWYFLQFFIPFFLDIPNFILIFVQLEYLIVFLSMPVVLIGCYLLHLFLIGLSTKIFWSISEKISPSKEGIIPRNISSKVANYYHIRGFMIKYGKNAFNKGVFPWLSNWYCNFVGTNKIGKGTVLEESVVNDKFIEVGKNCYLGVNSALATHVVEGIFGNISYFKVRVGDNVTGATTNLIGPGSEIRDNSFMLPLACATKHSIVGKPPAVNYYWGMPLRRIFRKKLMNYLGVSAKALEKNENIKGYADKELLKTLKAKELLASPQDTQEPVIQLPENPINIKNLTDKDLEVDFATSSAISRVNLKFLAVYLPIFWLAGLIISIFWYWYLSGGDWMMVVIFLPFTIFGSIYFFIFACMLFSKLFLTLINLIHKPKEGVFRAEIGDKDFEFWMLRTELKKIVLWFMRYSPFPWLDVLAFKLFGINMDTSSHLNDTWCDGEFIKFGRKNLIGQGANIMSSMVVGKYLIIKKVIFDDYVMVGGHTTIVPGTIVGKETIVGAISTTTTDQVLESGWIYTGIPVLKFKPNKYSGSRREILMRKDVDDAKKYEIEHEVNIDEDKKKLIKPEEEAE